MDGMMELRPASRSDLPALQVLIESAYRGDSARRGWTHEADLLGGQRTDADALGAMLDDPQQCLLVGWEGNRPSACVALTLKPGGLVYIGLVTVDPEKQGGGMGRRLLDVAEHYAASHLGANRAEMTVIAQRVELIAWYERRGYAQTGERRPFPMSDPRFGLPKRGDLEFVVLEKPIISAGSAFPSP